LGTDVFNQPSATNESVAIVSPAACSLQADCNCQPSCRGVTVPAWATAMSDKNIERGSRILLRMITSNSCLCKSEVSFHRLCSSSVKQRIHAVESGLSPSSNGKIVQLQHRFKWPVQASLPSASFFLPAALTTCALPVPAAHDASAASARAVVRAL